MYVANGAGANLHIMAGLTSGWAMADVIVDGSLMVAGTALLALASGGAAAAAVPAEISSMADLGAAMFYGAGLGWKGFEATQMIDAFKKSSVSVSPDMTVDVYSEGFLKQYLTPAGVAGMLGGDTVALIVLNDATHQVAHFEGGPDDSWIAKSDKIVHSTYGTLWQEDSSKPSVSWK